MPYQGPFPISGGKFTGATDEILVSGTNFSGGVTNAGTISGGGVVVVSSTLLVPGGIVNISRITGSQIGIDVSASTIQGGIVDSGVILAASAGILVNSGVVSGGIKVGTNGAIIANGTGGNAIEVENAPTFGGGISNSGKISAGQTGIFAGAHAGGTHGPRSLMRTVTHRLWQTRTRVPNAKVRWAAVSSAQFKRSPLAVGWPHRPSRPP